MENMEKNLIVLIIEALIGLSIVAITFAGMWKCFEKSGEKGWKAIIPIYSFYVMCKIAKISGWFTVLLFIPFVNYIAAPVLYFKFARAFEKSTLFCVGNATLLLSPIMMLIIGYGDSQYIKEIPEDTKKA